MAYNEFHGDIYTADHPIGLRVTFMDQQYEDPIRVLIVDDTDVVRSGLRIALETFDGIDLVGEAANGQEAVQLCAQLKPNVVIMDLVMPVMDGITATEIIRERHQDTKVLVLTSTTDVELIELALEKGATAYLLKNLSLNELESAIHLAYESELSD